MSAVLRHRRLCKNQTFIVLLDSSQGTPQILYKNEDLRLFALNFAFTPAPPDFYVKPTPSYLILGPIFTIFYVLQYIENNL